MLGKTNARAFRNVARLNKILKVFARNGFDKIVQRMGLGRFLTQKLLKGRIQHESMGIALRVSFEELGPTFVKLGQLLAMRPDIVPEDVLEELKKLHDQVTPLSSEIIKKVVEKEFGSRLNSIFSHFDERPLAAASIAQVHRATLCSGETVVVKIQRPGMIEVIRDDIRVLRTLAELLERYVPESRVYNPKGIVDEFFQSLELETDFIVEANNIRRFYENFKNEEKVIIPKVYLEYSSSKILVLEALNGMTLSQKGALEQKGVDPETVLRIGIRSYLRQVFEFGLFHADLHSGNVFILPDNFIGMIDFGIVGHLNQRVRGTVANMFVALYSEDYDKLAFEYTEVSRYKNSMDLDAFASDLQRLLAPYYGLKLKNVDLGRLLLQTTTLAARHELILPSELMLFFKSIVTVEGMAKLIYENFDFLEYALEFSDEILNKKYSSDFFKNEAKVFGQESFLLAQNLPRQLRQLFRRWNHPEYTQNLSLVELPVLRRSIEKTGVLIFLGLLIGSLIISAALFGSLSLADSNRIPLVSLLFLFLAAGFGGIAFYTYIKKS